MRLEGVPIAKERVRMFYFLEPGDQFHELHHRRSIENMKLFFQQQGYLHVHITDTLSYDERNKTVTVKLHVDAGPRFKIVTHHIAIDSDFNNMQQVVLAKIEKKIMAMFSGSYYEEALVAQAIDVLKTFLINHGILGFEVCANNKINNEKNEIAVEIIIDLQRAVQCKCIGNTFFSDERIFHIIAAMHHAMDLLPDEILEHELEKAYIHKGFLQARVAVCHDDDAALKFSIKEGLRANIDEIELSFVSTDEQLLKNECKDFFLPLLHQHLDQDIVQQCCEKMLGYLKNSGYWHAKIIKQSYVCIDSDRYRFVLVVEKGPLQYVDAIEIDTYPHLLTTEPFRSSLAVKPLPLSNSLIQKQQDALLHYVKKRINENSSVRWEIKNINGKRILHWIIQEDACQSLCGKIIVTGITRLPFRYIVRHIPLQEGQLWTTKDLDQTITYLQRTGLFETILINPCVPCLTDKTMDIVLKVVDDDPFEVKLRAGFQQVSKNLAFRKGTTYKVGASLVYKNTLNMGDSFSFDTDITKFYRYFSMQYRIPWLFNVSLDSVVKGYANKYTQPVRIGEDDPLYTVWQEGFLWGIHYKFSHGYVGSTFGFEYMKLSNLSAHVARAINFESQLIEQRVPYFFVEPTVFIDYLDDKVNPTSGSLTVVTLKNMFSTQKGGVNFLRLQCEQSFFIPISKSVLAIRGRFGNIFNQELRYIMPPERFFLGGANTLRAYCPDLAPPLGMIVEGDGARKLVPQGGRVMINGNMEWRFPIYKAIWGTLFQDVGALLEDSFAQVEGNRFLAATGFGIRCNTPIGPVRFDIGWKWKKDEQEDSWYAWFLTLGNAF